jgi:DNA-binding CsgD family transcriptional regulator
MRSLRDWAHIAEANAAASRGNLARTIELTCAVLSGPYTSYWDQAALLLSFAALLACDEEALRLAVATGDRAVRTAPGLADRVATARGRLQLLEGQPSTVDLSDDDYYPTCGLLWLDCREAIDAGAATAALDSARTMVRPVPHLEAVLAAVEAAATGYEDRWHDALTIALDQDLRLIAVDALEGLAATAARTESWAESLRLLGAAARLREETDYRWRFGFEQMAVERAQVSAISALGDGALTASTEGGSLDWREAAAYARRARGERKRPSHGWPSLTPTERQVVALVAEGLTNPEIAERLLMGRATVKTHLVHIFTKLRVRTRSQLASEAARQPTPGKEA